jgi:hypothetical protein
MVRRGYIGGENEMAEKLRRQNYATVVRDGGGWGGSSLDFLLGNSTKIQ